MQKLVFLSHIHQEKEMAIAIQSAIEEEFSGFVKVFVSSDSETILPGANFLKKIESGLSSCIAAIYLISPTSVMRPWINFELGAVWVRSIISQEAGGPEIPALPFCHSGMDYSRLPQPVCNLNAIMATDASSLEMAFKSIQRTLGVNGRFRTDFDKLASDLLELETKYTTHEKIKLAFQSLQKRPRMDQLKRGPKGEFFELYFIEQSKVEIFNSTIPTTLRKDIYLIMDGSGLVEFSGVAKIGGHTSLHVSEKGMELIKDYII